ncbi:MAG: intradiol ring-cleavage dioxygenase [Sporichthyaceae bacterium]
MHDHDGGLAHDLPRLLSRRRALGLVGGAAGAALLAACGGNDATSAAPVAEQPSAATTTGPGGAQPNGASPGAPPPGGGPGGGPGGAPPTGETVPAGEIPAETAGPYPGDGSNGPNVLNQSGVVRRDIRTGFAGAAATAAGVPLTVRLTITDHGAGGPPLEGAAVYLWHCDRDGRYSLYSTGLTDQNYLRGVQVADADGVLEFTTVFPGCYDGRWPHIHFEVYPDLATATKAGTKLRTTQLALPEDVSKTVYATDGYATSVANLSRTSLASDNVFSDGYALQLAKVTGSVADGYVATLGVPV